MSKLDFFTGVKLIGGWLGWLPATVAAACGFMRTFIVLAFVTTLCYLVGYIGQCLVFEVDITQDELKPEDYWLPVQKK